MLGISIPLFRGNSLSKLNLIFIYLSSSEFINLIKFLISLHSFSFCLSFFFFFLLSLEGTSLKYSFPLIYSKYPFTLLKIKYKGFTLLKFRCFESLIVIYSMWSTRILNVWLFIYFIVIWINTFISIISLKK